MRSILSVLLTALTCLAGTLITYGIMVAGGFEQTGIIFIMGGIVGTQMAVWRMVKAAGQASIPLKEKALAGLVLGVTNGVTGVVLQWVAHPFLYPEIVIPIEGVGSFVFPFVLTGTLAKSFARVANRTRA